MFSYFIWETFDPNFHLSRYNLTTSNELDCRVNIQKPSWINQWSSIPFQLTVIPLSSKKPINLTKFQSNSKSTKIHQQNQIFLTNKASPATCTHPNRSWYLNQSPKKKRNQKKIWIKQDEETKIFTRYKGDNERD